MFKDSIFQILRQFQDERFAGTQSKAAEALGVSQSAWNNWMTGSFNPKLDLLAQVMDSIGVVAVMREEQNPADKIAALDCCDGSEGLRVELEHQKQLNEMLRAESKRKDQIIDRLFQLLNTHGEGEKPANTSLSA